MEITVVDGHGLMLPGDVPSHAAARDAAREWLLQHGMDGFDAESAVTTAEVRRAWWGGAAVGFVGQDHPDAQLVVVVHLGADAIAGGPG